MFKQNCIITSPLFNIQFLNIQRPQPTGQYPPQPPLQPSILTESGLGVYLSYYFLSSILHFMTRSLNENRHLSNFSYHVNHNIPQQALVGRAYRTRCRVFRQRGFTMLNIVELCRRYACCRIKWSFA